METSQERVWTDHCEHPEDSYLGTVWFMEDGRRQAWDIYVYQDYDGAHACFRYGEEPSEYISPGNFGDCVERIGYDEGHHYNVALRFAKKGLAKRASALCRARAHATGGDAVFEALADLFDCLRA